MLNEKMKEVSLGDGNNILYCCYSICDVESSNSFGYRESFQYFCKLIYITQPISYQTHSHN